MSFDLRRAAVALAGSCAFINLYATQPMLPVLARDFGITATEVGLTITASLAAVALVAPLMGAIADGIGRKRVIVAAALLLTVPTLLAAHSGGLWELLFWRFVQGLLLPPIFAVTVAYIGEEFPPAEITAASGVYLVGTVLGGFLGRLLSGFATDLWSWQGAFVLLAATNFVCALGIARWLPPERNFHPVRGLGATLESFAGHLTNPRLMATAAVGFTLLFSVVATFTYANFYLAEPPFDLGPSALGSVFVVYLFGIVVTTVGTRSANRLGRVRTLAAALALSAAGLGITLLPSLPAVMIGLGAMSAGIFVAQALATSFIGVSVTRGKSAAVGVYVTCYYIGGSLGAVLPSPLWHRFGWPGCVALVVAAECAMMAIAGWAWRERPGPAITGPGVDPALDGVPKTG